MDDTNPFAPAAALPRHRHAGGASPASSHRTRRRRRRCGRRVAGGREVQVVPLARHAGRRGVLHPSRRAAVCRQGRVRRRVVVPGVRVLQAAPHAEEAGAARRIYELRSDTSSPVAGASPSTCSRTSAGLGYSLRSLRCRYFAYSEKLSAPAPPTRPLARAPGTSSSAASLPASARVFSSVTAR